MAEINTADFPLLYESGVERIDYAGATLDQIMFPMGADEIPSYADGTMDYVHVNSLDYTLNEEGGVDKLLVSMRDQCAVFQFDMLQHLAGINARLEDVDVEQVLHGNPLKQASLSVDYLLEHLEEFRIVMGSHGDPRFENMWRRDIADSFKDRFLKEKRDPQRAGLACAIFSSTLIGIYRYFIFQNPMISKEDFALILGNTFKYALQDFLPGKR